VLAVNYAACSGNWSPISSSGPESTLSGVLAGFVFAGIVVVLSVRRPDRDMRGSKDGNPRIYALQFLLAAFIIFTLDSYFSSVTSGELACNRAYAETVLSGGILGTAAVMLVASISWLIVAYSDPSDEIRIVLKAILVGIWTVIIGMLTLSAVDEGESLLPSNGHSLVNVAPWVIGIVASLCVILVAKHARRIKDGQLRVHVFRAVLASIAAAFLSGFFTAAASGFTAKWWYRPPSAAVYVIVALSLLIPLGALLVSVTAAWTAVSPTRDPSSTKARRSTQSFLELLRLHNRASLHAEASSSDRYTDPPDESAPEPQAT
jgi:hypothetical protein